MNFRTDFCVFGAMFTRFLKATRWLVLAGFWVSLLTQPAEDQQESTREAHDIVAAGPKWKRVAPPGLQPGQSENIALAFTPQFIYLGTHPQGLFRYWRQDRVWSRINSQLPSDVQYGFNPGSLRIAPQKATTLYAGIEGHGALRSVDAGLTWTSLGAGLESGAANVICFALHPDNPQRLLAGTDDGLYASDNGGASWAKVRQGLLKDYQGGGKPSSTPTDFREYFAVDSI